MSTLTIDLPDDLAARLAVASEQKHVPPATIVREALERTSGRRQRRHRKAGRSVML